MTSVWKKPAPAAPVDLKSIIREQSDEVVARKLQFQEAPDEFAHLLVPSDPTSSSVYYSTTSSSSSSSASSSTASSSLSVDVIDEDEALARLLQQQFEAESREEARRLADPSQMIAVSQRDTIHIKHQVIPPEFLVVENVEDDDDEEDEPTNYEVAAKKAHKLSSAGQIITRQNVELSDARQADRVAEFSFAEVGDPSAISHISSRAANALQISLRKKVK